MSDHRTRLHDMPHVDVLLYLYEKLAFGAGKIPPVKFSSEEAAEVIAAAGIPLVGWERPIQPGWLAVKGDPLIDALVCAGVRYQDNRPPGAQRSESWGVSTGLVYRSVHDEHLNVLFRTGNRYEFDASGALVRTLSVDLVAETVDQTPVQIRSPGDSSPVTDEVALGVMAALLGELDKCWISLSRTSTTLPAKIERAGRRFLLVLNEFLAERPHDSGAHMVQALCTRYLADVHAGRLDVEKRPRRAEARIWFMGPLQVAFTLLFGKAATTRFKHVDDAEDVKDEADGPFINFAFAFFSMVGCPCRKNTVNSALGDWRHPRKRRPE